ncbi:MAG: hypothetical protein AB7R69_03800 [Candidatus Babeliales bacterium]
MKRMLCIGLLVAGMNSNIHATEQETDLTAENLMATLSLSEELVAILKSTSTAQEDTLESNEERKTDIAIFRQFMRILASFSKILIDRHNKANITLNATCMVDSILNIANELTKRGNPTQAQLDNFVRLLIHSLCKQGIIPAILENPGGTTYSTNPPVVAS